MERTPAVPARRTACVLPVEALRPRPRRCCVGGLVYLAIAVERARARWSPRAIAVRYLLLYTPLKPVTSLCSLVGAVPGALPPVAGWAARSRHDIGPEAVVAIRDHVPVADPHTLAIGRMYRDDYARAGIRVLPVIDRDGSSTATHAVVNCLALLPGRAPAHACSAWPGPLYFATALAARPRASCGRPIGLARTRSLADARRLLVVSARLPAGPPRHDGARQAPDHAMTTGTLTMPRTACLDPGRVSSRR